MATAFTPHSPEKIHNDLESALNPEEKASGKVYIFPKQPTEIFPDEEISVDTGVVYDRPKTKRKTQVDVFKESPEGIALANELKSILPAREESRELSFRAQALGEGGQHMMSPDELDKYNREMGIDRPIQGKPYDDYRRPEWKKKLNSARDFLRTVGSKDSAKKSLKFISEISLGPLMDPNAVIQTLAEAYNDGLLPLGELESVEKMLDISVPKKEGQNKPTPVTPNVVEKEPVLDKVSELAEEASIDQTEDIVSIKKVRTSNPRKPIDIPGPEPISANIDTTDIQNTLQKKYEVKKTPVADKIVSELSLGSDDRYAVQARKSYEEGNIGDAMVYIEKIKEEYDQDMVVREIVIDSVDKKDFATARRFVSKIKDTNYKVELGGWVDSHVSVEVPSVRTSYGEPSLKKEETSAFQGGVSAPTNMKESVVNQLETEQDLPLRTEKEISGQKDIDLMLNDSGEKQTEKPTLSSGTEIPVLTQTKEATSDSTEDYSTNIKIKRQPSFEPIPILGVKNEKVDDEKSKIIIPEGFYSKRSATVYPEKKIDDNSSIKADINNKRSLEIKAEFDNKIRDLRDQIKAAEKTRDEALVVNLEGQLRTIERQKIQLGKAFESSGTDEDRKIKEQIAKVKSVENSDEKAYVEELAKLRTLERERDSKRAPKTEQKIEVTPEKKVEIKSETIETTGPSLDKARDDYADAYIDWEIKSRKGKKLFAKTLLDLGASRPTPARLSSKTPAMEEAKREYEKAMKNSGIEVNSDAKKLLLSERLLLENRLQEVRAEKSQKSNDPEIIKETNLLDKALKTWNKTSGKQKALTSALILGGGIMLGVVGEEGRDFYEGLRVDRNVSTDGGELPQVSQAPKVFPLPEKLSEIQVPLEVPPVNIIKVKKVEAVPPSPVSVTSVVSSVPTPEVVTPKTLETVTPEPITQVDVTIQAEPAQIVEPTVIPTGDVVEKVAPKVPEQPEVVPEVVRGELQNHIPYGGGFLDIVNLDNGIGRAVTYNGIEIAHERDVHGEKLFSLDDQYQKDGHFMEIRAAFKVFLEANFPKDLIWFKPAEFEGGLVHLIRDPSSDDRVLALLNGKEVGTASLSKKKVKFEILHDLKGGWFLADNVYEKACKVANQEVRAFNKIPRIPEK